MEAWGPSGAGEQLKGVLNVQSLNTIHGLDSMFLAGNCCTVFYAIIVAHSLSL